MNRASAAVFLYRRCSSQRIKARTYPTTTKHTYQEDPASFSLNKYLRYDHDAGTAFCLGAAKEGVRRTQYLQAGADLPA